jgi:hypothetical protein
VSIRPAVAVLLAALAAPCPTPAQQPQDPLATCAEKLVPYSSWREPSSDWLLLQAWNGSGGELYYFGTRHSNDPRHPQLACIEHALESFEPTLLFYEGFEDQIETSRDDTVRRYGEPGFVRYLAAVRGVAATTLEPDPRDEIGHLLPLRPPEQVKIYSLLRETVLRRERLGHSKEEIRDSVGRLARTRIGIPALDSVITSLAELEEAFERHWPQEPGWSEAPGDWFDPRQSSAMTGGLFTNDLERASAEYRDLHMYRLLARAARRGERVFAAVGRTHLPAQEPALRCALLAAGDGATGR